MAKPRKAIGDIQNAADGYLNEIALRSAEIEALIAEAQTAMEALEKAYSEKVKPLTILLKSAEVELMQTMRFNKAVLFDGTDVVNLPHGRLIHERGDKVKIPRTALGSCEAQGFTDVIKIVKSLDRESIEKWPDERLFLIGAERKPSETFNYEVKK